VWNEGKLSEAQLRIHGPGASASYRQEEENEAVEDRQLSLVKRRHKEMPLPGMHKEISYGHLPGQNQGYRARKQPHKQQQTSGHLEDSGNAVSGKHFELIEPRDAWHVKQLGGTVLQVQKRAHQAQCPERFGCPAAEEVLTESQVNAPAKTAVLSGGRSLSLDFPEKAGRHVEHESPHGDILCDPGMCSHELYLFAGVLFGVFVREETHGGWRGVTRHT
jgi:hypothetical protein